MIKILIPETKGRKKSKIRGFWKIETLKKCYICHLTKNKLGNGALIYNVKKWLNEYNGITIYINKSEYIIEAWRV